MGVERLDLSGELGTSPGYAYAARAQGLVFTAGAVPLDPEGNLVGEGDLEEQTRVVVSNLKSALEAAGAGPEDVLKTTIYVVGERSELSRAWRVFAESPYVAAPSTLLGVTHLGYDGQLVEIEAVAAAGG